MSKQRQKGTSFETSLLPLLKQYYPSASRAPLRGTKDEGDFILDGAPFVLEAKNHKEMKLAEWLREAEAEALNAAVARGSVPGEFPVGVVVAKRRGVTDPAEQYAVLTLGDFLHLVNRGR